MLVGPCGDGRGGVAVALRVLLILDCLVEEKPGVDAVRGSRMVKEDVVGVVTAVTEDREIDRSIGSGWGGGTARSEDVLGGGGGPVRDGSVLEGGAGMVRGGAALGEVGRVMGGAPGVAT